MSFMEANRSKDFLDNKPKNVLHFPSGVYVLQSEYLAAFKSSNYDSCVSGSVGWWVSGYEVSGRLVGGRRVSGRWI